MSLGKGSEWGIAGVGVMPSDASSSVACSDQEGLYTLILRDSSDEACVSIIGSLLEYVFAPNDPERVFELLVASATRIVSLTVTEGGYMVDPSSGQFDTKNLSIQADLVEGSVPTTMFGYLAEGLRRRRERGIAPFTVMSCDNIQGNGDVARSSVVSFAALRDREFAEWISNNVCFPNSMVDRITPATRPEDIAALRHEFDLDDAWPVVSEPFTQWVLEDRFSNGRPRYEEVGVQLTSHVEPYERMKLRLLNGSHQALAYSGRLAGYTYVHEAASDPVFAEFITRYMNDDARRTLADVPGIDLDEYIKTLIERFGNSAIRDTIARLCAFGSDRIPKWVVPVVHADLDAGRMPERAIGIIASWARYCDGADEQGENIDVQDSLSAELRNRARRRSIDKFAFVRDRGLFGDLIDNPRFLRCYEKCLDMFYNLGARETVSRLGAWDGTVSASCDLPSR